MYDYFSSYRCSTLTVGAAQWRFTGFLKAGGRAAGAGGVVRSTSEQICEDLQKT